MRLADRAPRTLLPDLMFCFVNTARTSPSLSIASRLRRVAKNVAARWVALCGGWLVRMDEEDADEIFELAHGVHCLRSLGIEVRLLESTMRRLQMQPRSPFFGSGTMEEPIREFPQNDLY